MAMEEEFSHFDNIDREWAALNNDFQQDIEVDIRELELQEQYEAIEQEIYQKFSLVNAVRVIDIDIEIQKERYSEFLGDRHVELFDALEEQKSNWSYEGVTVEEDVDLWVESLFQYYERRALEESMIQDAAYLRHSVMLSDGSDEGSLYRQITKKFTQAHMYCYEGWHPEHPFQHFFDEMTEDIPGLSFYFADDSTVVCREPVDEFFLEIAKMRYKKYQSGQSKKRWIVKEAMKLIGNMDKGAYDSNLGRLLDVAGDLIAMLEIATVSTPTDIDRLHKRNALWEAGRMMELDNDVALSNVVELYMLHYGYGNEV